MKNISFYEQAGIVIPGSVLLFGLLVLFPDLQPFFENDGITVGGFGLFLLLSYAGGHGVAAGGNLLETVWWSTRGGMPSDWVTSERPRLLTDQQIENMRQQIDVRLGLKLDKIRGLPPKEWSPVFRQVFRDALTNNPGRVEAFNGMYGLNRGIAAALVCLAAVVLVTSPTRWIVLVALVVAAGVYIFRMDRFGVHFAREVYLGFLNIGRDRSTA